MLNIYCNNYHIKDPGGQFEGVHIGKIPLFCHVEQFSMTPSCRRVGPGENSTGEDLSQTGQKGEFLCGYCRPICRPCAARWGGSHLGSSPPGTLGHPHLVNDMG